MARQFNEIIYPRRQLVENKFSVLKRKFNSDFKARRFRIQIKEIANKMIICNIHRFLLFLTVEVFYRAEKRGIRESQINPEENSTNLIYRFADTISSRYSLLP